MKRALLALLALGQKLNRSLKALIEKETCHTLQVLDLSKKADFL